MIVQQFFLVMNSLFINKLKYLVITSLLLFMSCKEKEEKLQRDIMKEITNLLIKESVAYDINGYPKAPASFRIWGGGTVEPDDINKLLPWIDWAYNKVRSSYA